MVGTEGWSWINKYSIIIIIIIIIVIIVIIIIIIIKYIYVFKEWLKDCETISETSSFDNTKAVVVKNRKRIF